MGKKPDMMEWMFIIAGVIFAFLAGLRFGTAHVDFEGKTNPNFLNDAYNDIQVRPTNIRVDRETIPFGLFGGGACAVGFMYYFMEQKNTMPGKEHGSAEWANKNTANSIIDKDYFKNILLTETERLSLNARKTKKNLNVLVIGGSGSGKTRFFVKPNIMQHNTSFVITDPKGELLKSTAGMLEKDGYDIKVLNLADMTHSNAYNPFAYIREDNDVMKMIDLLIKNTTPPQARTGDPFWEKSEAALLQAICYYLYHEAPYEEQNFSMVMELLRSAEVRESDEAYESDLDLLFNHLRSTKPNHIALKQYAIFKQAAGQTAKSILISIGVRLAKFNTREIGALTITDNIRLEEVGLKKTALYVVIPDSHDSYNFLVAMMYSQMFDSLYHMADSEFGGRLPLHVRFLLDEFANIGQIPEFDKKVATMRSREVSVAIIIQNLAQLKSNYKDTWESITGNCDSMLFLGGQEQSTLEYISKRLGKTTIDLKSTGQTKSKQNSSTVNYGLHGRELMTPDEVSRMPDKNCILLIRGMKPFYSNKIDIKKHKEYSKIDDTNQGSNFAYVGINTPFDMWENFFHEFA